MTAQRLRMSRPSRRSLGASLLCALVLAIVGGSAQAQPACQEGENRVEFPSGEITAYTVPAGVQALR